MRIKDKVAIITGGTNGIGKATVELFIKEGAQVVVADLDDNGADLAKSLSTNGSECLFIRTDVTKETDVRNLVEETVNKFGKLDIMFANAGIGESAMAHEMTMSDWQRVIEVNLSSVFLTNKIAIEAMLESGGGSIINNSSVLGLVGQPSVTANAAAKGGVSNLTRTLGVNYAKEGIRVNSICPGYTLTPLITSKPKEFIDGLIANHPIGRLAEPEEIANVVLFLASDDSSYIAGSNILVDGGYTAQ
ncbi:SDR family NAD(P)-dependent oxidoreductase [Sporosarcina jiandibaonis]|uniref:SDR family NAD(P)-dependent oxidoreductase n=1 Tax=Sporosarcina jiandibaonis TaxID=2715535 RepID=UPI0015573EF8|nr:glucose 1-dehydrogenase [Sporosarcina jiandibaonis]